MNRRALVLLFITALASAGLGAVTGCAEPPARPDPITPPVEPPPPEPPPPPPPPAPPPRLGVTRILAFGDSMTEGTTSSPLSIWRFALTPGRAESYPYKLQTLLTARYTEQTIEVLNAGWAGRRASQDRERFNSEMSQVRPDVILLMEGANDLNAPFAPGEGINDRIGFTVGSLEDLVKDSTYRPIPIFIATLPPQRKGGSRAGAAEFLTRFNDALKAMATAKGGTVVDMFAALSLSDVGQDGLHLTEAGYQRMAEIWLDALQARYEVAGGAAQALSTGDISFPGGFAPPDPATPSLAGAPRSPRRSGGSLAALVRTTRDK